MIDRLDEMATAPEHVMIANKKSFTRHLRASFVKEPNRLVDLVCSPSAVPRSKRDVLKVLDHPIDVEHLAETEASAVMHCQIRCDPRRI